MGNRFPSLEVRVGRADFKKLREMANRWFGDGTESQRFLLNLADGASGLVARIEDDAKRLDRLERGLKTALETLEGLFGEPGGAEASLGPGGFKVVLRARCELDPKAAETYALSILELCKAARVVR